MFLWALEYIDFLLRMWRCHSIRFSPHVSYPACSNRYRVDCVRNHMAMDHQEQLGMHKHDDGHLHLHWSTLFLRKDDFTSPHNSLDHSLTKRRGNGASVRYGTQLMLWVAAFHFRLHRWQPFFGGTVCVCSLKLQTFAIQWMSCKLRMKCLIHFFSVKLSTECLSVWFEWTWIGFHDKPCQLSGINAVQFNLNRPTPLLVLAHKHMHMLYYAWQSLLVHSNYWIYLSYSRTEYIRTCITRQRKHQPINVIGDSVTSFVTR